MEVETENIAKCLHSNPTSQTVKHHNPSPSYHQYRTAVHTEIASMYGVEGEENTLLVKSIC